MSRIITEFDYQEFMVVLQGVQERLIKKYGQRRFNQWRKSRQKRLKFII